MTHTPGPWRVTQERNATVPGHTNIGAGDYGSIASTSYRRPSLEENEANARLIAAAPELLALLVEWPVNMPASEWNAWHDRRRALLARITTP